MQKQILSLMFNIFLQSIIFCLNLFFNFNFEIAPINHPKKWGIYFKSEKLNFRIFKYESYNKANQMIIKLNSFIK